MEKQEDTITIVPASEFQKLSHLSNTNIGVMGHIDSGKTALCKILTQTPSTASLDKNPQSKEQGITIDIGFSSFSLRISENQYKQYTLVDCPGHASFIKSVIAGASIIDLMILVIDIKKGIQVQTAECIALGEIMRLKVIIVLNKCDTLKDGFNSKMIEKSKVGLKNLFEKTSFANKSSFEIIEFSCKEINQNSLDKLLKAIVRLTGDVKRDMAKEEKTVMVCDHCFNIKGKGTVLTGTVTKGKLAIDDEIELPEHGITKKVKSIQVFRKNVKSVQKGDRASVLVSQLNAEEIERCLITSKGLVKKASALFTKLNFCSYYKGSIASRSKFHISIGHVNIMADVWLFCSDSKDFETLQALKEKLDNFDIHKAESIKYRFDKENRFRFIKQVDKEKVYFPDDSLTYKELEDKGQYVMALLVFPKPLFLLEHSFLLGSRFDFQIDKKNCRIAFWGIGLDELPEAPKNDDIKLFSIKKRYGTIEKFFNPYTAILKDIFKKETNLTYFLNKEVYVEGTELVGRIQSGFGSSGKVKVVFNEDIKNNHPDIIGMKARKPPQGAGITLKYDYRIVVHARLYVDWTDFRA